MDVYYTATVTGTTVTVSLRAVNNARDGAAVAVTATFASSPAVRAATPSASTVRLSPQLPAGADCQGSTDLTLLGDAVALATAVTVGCTVHVATESLLGPDTTALQGTVKVVPI